MDNQSKACTSRVGVMLSVQLLFLALAACGGGGGGSAGDTSPPPVNNGGNGNGNGNVGNQSPARDVDGDSVADASDCAPDDATRWHMLDFASVDNDGDTFRVNSSGQLCVGDNLPSDHSATAVTGEAADCDDADVGKWRTLTFLAEDADGDGYAVNTSGELCGQETLPTRLRAVASSLDLTDCDDADPNKWRRIGIYRDLDGDGSGSGPATRLCMGATLPSGYVLPGDDPLDDPNDPSSRTVSTTAMEPALLMPAQAEDEEIYP